MCLRAFVCACVCACVRACVCVCVCVCVRGCYLQLYPDVRLSGLSDHSRNMPARKKEMKRVGFVGLETAVPHHLRDEEVLSA